VIDRGHIGKRKKETVQKVTRRLWTHSSSIEEDIPWKCRRLVIDTGTGAMPVMQEVKREAHRRKIRLAISPTTEAINALQENPDEIDAILHVTC
jgi:hypothetical protein